MANKETEDKVLENNKRLVSDKHYIPPNKWRSRTLWITIFAIALNPIAWIFDFFSRRYFFDYLIQNDLLEKIRISEVVLEIPLATIATVSLTIASLFVGGNKARDTFNEVSRNQTLPPGYTVRDLHDIEESGNQTNNFRGDM